MPATSIVSKSIKWVRMACLKSFATFLAKSRCSGIATASNITAILPAISIPITAVDDKTLQMALDAAVKEENYELAIKLKEEMDSRQKHDKQ